MFAVGFPGHNSKPVSCWVPPCHEQNHWNTASLFFSTSGCLPGPPLSTDAGATGSTLGTRPDPSLRPHGAQPARRSRGRPGGVRAATDPEGQPWTRRGSRGAPRGARSPRANLSRGRPLPAGAGSRAGGRRSPPLLAGCCSPLPGRSPPSAGRARQPLSRPSLPGQARRERRGSARLAPAPTPTPLLCLLLPPRPSPPSSLLPPSSLPVSLQLVHPRTGRVPAAAAAMDIS